MEDEHGNKIPNVKGKPKGRFGQFKAGVDMANKGLKTVDKVGDGIDKVGNAGEKMRNMF